MKNYGFLLLFFVLFPTLILGESLKVNSVGRINSHILVLSQDDLFKKSLPGIELLKIFEEKQTKLFSEARKIEQEFIVEEKSLTEKRATLTVDEFQLLADEFDVKVERMRQIRTEKDKELQKQFMTWKKKFVQIVLPIIRDVMSQFNALVVLDAKNRGLIYDQKIDITEGVIELLNAQFVDDPQIIDKILSTK